MTGDTNKTPVAAIDIGTNSVLLLIATFDDNALTPIREESRITRLGMGTGSSGMLTDGAMGRTLAVLAEYAAICRDEGVGEISAVGTASLRMAGNADIFVARAKDECGIAIDVISKEREAWLTYRASAESFGDDIAVMDVGGGSTEFIAPQEGGAQRTWLASLNLGVVSLTEQFLPSDPVRLEEIERARDYIGMRLGAELDAKRFQDCSLFVATAGTATTLAAMRAEMDPYNPAKAHGMHLGTDDVVDLIMRIRGRSIAELQHMKGLQRGREDVILAGALITLEAMNLLGYDGITVSDRGVRWGTLIERYL